MEPCNISKEFLEREYVILGKTVSQIAKENGLCKGTIWDRIYKYDIPRKRGPIAARIDVKEAIRLYVQEQWHITDISKMLGCHPTSLRNALVSEGVVLRSKPEVFADIKVRRRKSQGRFRGFGEIGLCYWNRIIGSAKARGILFDLSIEYAWHLFVNQQGLCIYSGVPIVFLDRVTNQQQTASLDRIDSDVGYIVGNVQWVHKTVQMMKNVLSDVEFVEWCILISKNKSNAG